MYRRSAEFRCSPRRLALCTSLRWRRASSWISQGLIPRRNASSCRGAVRAEIFSPVRRCARHTDDEVASVRDCASSGAKLVHHLSE